MSIWCDVLGKEQGEVRNYLSQNSLGAVDGGLKEQREKFFQSFSRTLLVCILHDMKALRIKLKWATPSNIKVHTYHSLFVKNKGHKASELIMSICQL